MRTDRMLTCLILALAVCATGTLGQNAAIGANQQAQALKKEITQAIDCNYLLYLPKGYGETDQKWPLMMFLHGAGERGADLNKVKVHGPPKLIEKGDDLPFIVVSPQCPGMRKRVTACFKKKVSARVRLIL